MDPDPESMPVPVQILDFVLREVNGQKLQVLELNKHALDCVMTKIGDTRIAVVAIAGASRQGKSFLLSFILRCLQFKADGENVDWMGWIEKERPLNGFRWRNGIRRETPGIWLWNTPFFIKLKDGETCAVLLMDTQGIYDSQTTPLEWSKIIGLSLLASSVLIFNLFTNLQDDVFKMFDDFLQYGLLAFEDGRNVNPETNPGLKPFQKLLFLIRDWNNRSEFPYGAEGGMSFLDEKLRLTDEMPDVLKHPRQNLKKCFESLECFLMPSPGEAAKDKDYNGCLAELNQQFSQQVEVFVNNLLDPAKLQSKHVGGFEMTGKTFGPYFSEHVAIFNSNTIPTPLSLYQVILRTTCFSLVEEAKKLYRHGMREKLNGNKFLKVLDLEASHRIMLNYAQDFYTSKVSNATHNFDINREFFQVLTDQITSVEYLEFVKVNDVNRNSATSYAVEQSLRESKANIENEIKEGFMEDSELQQLTEIELKRMMENFNINTKDESEIFLEPFISSLLEKQSKLEEHVVNVNLVRRGKAEKIIQKSIEEAVGSYIDEFEAVLLDGDHLTQSQFNENHDKFARKSMEIVSEACAKIGNPLFTKEFVGKYEKQISAQLLHFVNKNQENLKRQLGNLVEKYFTEFNCLMEGELKGSFVADEKLQEVLEMHKLATMTAFKAQLANVTTEAHGLIESFISNLHENLITQEERIQSLNIIKRTKAQEVNKAAVDQAKQHYRQHFEPFLSDDKYLNKKNFDKHHDLSVKEALFEFETLGKLGDSTFIQEYELKLRQGIQKQQTLISKMNLKNQERAASSGVETCLRKVKENLDHANPTGNYMDEKHLKAILHQETELASIAFRLQFCSIDDILYLQALISTLQERLIEFENAALVLNAERRTEAEKCNQKLLDESLTNYIDEFSRVIAELNMTSLTGEQLLKTHRKLLEQSLDLFKFGSQDGPATIVNAYEKKLVEEITKAQIIFEKENNRNREKAEIAAELLLISITDNYKAQMEEVIGNKFVHFSLDDLTELHHREMANHLNQFQESCALNHLAKFEQFTKRLEVFISQHFTEMMANLQCKQAECKFKIERFVQKGKDDYCNAIEGILESATAHLTNEFMTQCYSKKTSILSEFDRAVAVGNMPKYLETASYRSKLEEQLGKTADHFETRNGQKIELLKAKARQIVDALEESYQDAMNDFIELAKNEAQLKSRHDLLKAKLLTEFQVEFDYPEISDEGIQRLNELDETYEEIVALYRLKRDENEHILKEVSRNAERIYKDDMDKRVKTRPFILPNILQTFHTQACERSLAGCDVISSARQREDLLDALEKLYLSYKEHNTLITPTVPAIGIDLGTTYTCAAVYLNDKVHVIANSQKKLTTPSYVSFNGKNVEVGGPAKGQAHRNPKNTIFNVKRLIGRTFDDPHVQKDMKQLPYEVIGDGNVPKIKTSEGHIYTPEQISAFILGEMKRQAEALLHCEVVNAVITVPAYFTDGQKQATIDAGKIAGLNVLRIIHEPTSAAIAYRIQHSAELFTNRNVLIFDLGGGTFDVAALSISTGTIDVKCIGGDTHLGGDDFDGNLVGYCIKEFKTQTGIDLMKGLGGSSLEVARMLRRLRGECERKKIELSSARSTVVDLPYVFGHENLKVTITREKFEELNRDMFAQTIRHVEDVLLDAKMTPESIDDIVLVGGSTKIPKIQELLTTYFKGRPLIQTINPDEAVAYGAAIQAAILNGNIAQTDRNYLEFNEVTAHSLGIEITKDAKFSVIIPKSSKIPILKTEPYVTIEDNQSSTRITIFEGENPLVAANTKLGNFVLGGIPLGKAGSQGVNVSMEINEQGILHVTAVCRSTGGANNLTVTEHKLRLSEGTIEEMLRRQKEMSVRETTMD